MVEIDGKQFKEFLNITCPVYGCRGVIALEVDAKDINALHYSPNLCPVCGFDSDVISIVID